MKTHQQPGDVGKRVKQAMLEGRHPDRKRSKAFRKVHLARERAVLKERTQEIIREGV